MNSHREVEDSDTTTATGGAPPRRWGIGTDLLLSLAARLSYVILRSLYFTWRVRIAHGEEHMKQALSTTEPTILCFWHEHLVMVGPWLTLRWLARQKRMAILTSPSRDGEILARLARSVGFDVVRGSASRGGSTAFRVLHRSLKKSRLSIAFAPDGPLGPRQEAKVGAIALAQATGAPIIALAGAATRGRRLGSWDRMVVPGPFARVSFSVGEPLRIPREAGEHEVERGRLRLQAVLEELGRLAGKDHERGGLSAPGGPGA